jgi:group I intron endonuclease
MFIYKITNKINEKIYIGQTKINPIKRFKQHCCAKTIFGKEIRLVGKENFSLEIICDNILEKDIHNLEVDYIKKYDCIYPNGYNRNKGGVYNKEMCQEARDAIGRAHKGKKLSEKQRLILNSIMSGENNPNRRKVICLNNGKIFDSLTEASIWCNDKNISNCAKISMCCSGKKYSYKGYFWSYLDNIAEPVIKTNRKKVKCIELDRVFESVTEAADYLKADLSYIAKCCKDKSKKCKGYTFQYITD